MNKTMWFGAYMVLSLLTLVVYWQGLHSNFYLDDTPNLSKMGEHLSLGYWHNIFIFLLEGRSGPTGRPLSLLSFYLNSSSYPADPWSFKLTNVVIHIINGALITLILLKITQLIDMSKQQAKWLILLSVGFWLLHPFQITTVLYVIQRMTELSALFILLGILAYIYGREWLSVSNEIQKRKIKPLFLLSFLIWSCITLAMLSKETGVLLLGYILVIEYCLLRSFKMNSTSKRLNYWLVITILIPFLGILGYVYWGGLSAHAFDSRPFTLEQRLLTETRIIFDYLANILIPGFSTPSLFHDDFPVSTSWFQPWTTFSSIIGLIILVFTAWFARIKHPILSFGISWFLVSHLIESTVVPLELYFEHRNYLAMLGPLVIIVYYTQQLISYKPKIRKVGYIFIGIFSLLIITNTLQNTILWNKPLTLITVWVKDHPHAIRAVQSLDGFEKTMHAKVMDAEVRASIQSLSNQQENQFFLSIRQLMFSCNKGALTEADLQVTQDKLQHTNNELATAQVLHGFIKEWQAGNCNNVSTPRMITFLESLLTVPHANIGTLKHVTYFGLSEAWKKERNLDKTIYNLTKAYEQAPSLGLLFAKVEYFTSAGLYNEALEALDDLSLLKTTFRKRLVIKLRGKEIRAVRNKIKQYQHLSKT